MSAVRNLRSPNLLSILPETPENAIRLGNFAAIPGIISTLDNEQQAKISMLAAEAQDLLISNSISLEMHRMALLKRLPKSVLTAIESDNTLELQRALNDLPSAESLVIVEQLQQAGMISIATPVGSSPHRIDQLIQDFLPLLGDIALAAHGDEAARQLAEAVLPRLEEGGWRLEQATRRLWAGERDGATLTAGIDPTSAALVQRTLRLVADGPGMIFAAGALQIANLRRQADTMSAQLLAQGSPEQRADLARQVAEVAGQAEQQPGAPWQELAAHLRALAAQLQEP